MKRGEVHWVVFGPSAGGEIRKTRPALIVSVNEANAVLNRVQVVPLTSNVTKVYPSEALVSLNHTPHKAAADQLATISKERVREYIGKLGADDMVAVERAIRKQLALT